MISKSCREIKLPEYYLSCKLQFLEEILFKGPEREELDSFFSSRVAKVCMRKGLLVAHPSERIY